MNKVKEAASVIRNGLVLLVPWVRRPWIPEVSYGTALLLACVFVAIQLLSQILQLRGAWYFNEYGIGVFCGNLGLAAAVCSLAQFGGGKIKTASAFAYVVANMAIFSLLLFFAWMIISTLVAAKIQVPGAVVWSICYFLLALAIFSAFRSGRAMSGVKSKMAGCVLAAATFAGLSVLPFVPVIGSDTSYARADLFYLARWVLTPSPTPSTAEDTSQPRVDWEKVLARQPELVAESLAKIQATDPSTPHAYLIGMAPYADQNVFKKEMAASQKIFTQHFNAEGRSIILQNADDARNTLPLASVTNLNLVATGLASKIDKVNDVVVLFITSHGGKGRISVEDYPLPLNDIKPEDIRYALSLTGARNRVVIISACYSDSFIEMLRDENTAIITAADADHTSFGCSNDREWTYFTNAFFNHGLRQTRDLKAAFEIASGLIQRWEQKMKIDESHPQFFMGQEVGTAWQKILPSFDQSASAPAASTEDKL